MTLKNFMEKTVRSLGFTGYDSFLYKAVIGWLAGEGYLASEKEPEADSGQRFVTPKGEAAGLREIRLQEAAPQGNEVISILCSEQFQGFLQGSMDKIMAFERRQWQPFLNCLTPEWYAGARARCSEKEISLTAALRQIIGPLPPDLPRKPGVTHVNLWLLRKGLLERVFIGGDKTYWPAYEGSRLGLGLSENRHTVYWPFAGQQFLVDNMEVIARDLASGEAYRLGPGPRRLTGARAALSQIKFAAQERSLSELTNMINQALAPIEEGAYRLPRGVIWAWLRSQGYLRTGQISETMKTRWALTDEGSAAGFDRNKNDDLVASEAGQRFVVEHLEEIWDLYLEIFKKPDEQQEPEAEEEISEALTSNDIMAEIVRSLGFTGFRPFLHAASICWLTQEGYLESAEPQAGSSKLPPVAITEKGKTIGLVKTESREDGSVALFGGKRFQGFLEGSMDKIMAFERKQWEPLLDCLTPEWYAGTRACCLEEDTSLRSLLQLIKSQLPSDLPRSPHSLQVFSWLVRKGLLERGFSNGIRVYWSTPAGREKGIVWDENRHKLRWSFTAQQFFVDNMEAMVRDLASGEAYRLGPVS